MKRPVRLVTFVVPVLLLVTAAILFVVAQSRQDKFYKNYLAAQRYQINAPTMPARILVTNTPEALSTSTKTTTQTPVAPSSPTPDLTLVAISAEETRISRATLAPSLVKVLGTAQIEIQSTNPYHGGLLEVRTLALSPNGRVVAIGTTHTHPSQRPIQLIEVPSGKVLRTLQGHNQDVGRMAFSPDGRTLASTGYEGKIKLWDVPSGKVIKTLEGGGVQVVFARNGKVLASISDDGVIQIWDVKLGKSIRTIATTHWLYSVALSPDGKILASAGGSPDIDLWNVATGAKIGSLIGHPDDVAAIAFSPDGSTLASAGSGSDETIRLWNVDTRKEILVLRANLFGVWSIAFSPNGRILASGGWGGGTVVLWDVQTGREIQILKGLGDALTNVAFSGDGQRLVANGDYLVKFWDISALERRYDCKNR